LPELHIHLKKNNFN